MQATLDTTTPLNVKVDSKFPPMMLLGRIDRVQVTVDRPYNDDLIVDLDGVSVSVPSLIAGKPSIEAEKCSTRNIDYNDVADQIQCLQVGE